METAKTQPKVFQILDGTMLKIIAMVCMVFDHVGDMFFSGVMWPRMIGRLAMPLFAFCIAEGFRYTHDKKKYLIRMGIFALVSEIPFDLAFTGTIDLSHQNIMLTFFLSILALMLYNLVSYSSDGKKRAWRIILGILIVLSIAALALLLKADYSVFAVISVFLFYELRNTPYPVRELAGVGFLAVTRTMGFYLFTGVSIIPLLLYNGKKGKGLKWLFYAFYPGHLLILFAIKKFVG